MENGEQRQESFRERRERVEEVIRSMPLLDHKSSLENLQKEMPPLEEASLYLGTGLTTSREIMDSVPFDIIGMICIAEKLRRELGMAYVVHLIADTHAKTNEFVNPAEVDILANVVMALLERITAVLGIDGHYIPIKASEFDSTLEYYEILDGMPGAEHEYVRREWSDIEYARRYLDARIKLSWTIGSKTKKVGFDERLYDARFNEVTGEEISFVYTAPGRTLDKNRAKVSPYISIQNEQRIVLDPDENVEKKIRDAESQGNKSAVRAAREHMGHIIDLCEEFRGAPLRGDSVEEKVQSLIDEIFE